MKKKQKYFKADDMHAQLFKVTKKNFDIALINVFEIFNLILF